MPHREDIRAFLESLTIDGKAIDWGSGTKPVKNYVKGNAEFYCIDKNPEVSPDMVFDITVPVHFEDKDYAFCIEVLEHVTYPDKVLKNIYRSLRIGGILYLSVPFMYPEHGEEDYWRFTKQGLRLLLSEFSDVRISDIDQGYIVEAVK